MTKSDFLTKFAGLRSSKPPLAKKKSPIKKTSPQLIQKKIPKVFLDLSATLPQKENNAMFADDLKEIFSRRTNFVQKLCEQQNQTAKYESPRPVLRPSNKPGNVNKFIRKRTNSFSEVYTKKIIQAGAYSSSDLNYKNRDKLMEIRQLHLQICSNPATERLS